MSISAGIEVVETDGDVDFPCSPLSDISIADINVILYVSIDHSTLLYLSISSQNDDRFENKNGINKNMLWRKKISKKSISKRNYVSPY